jgi:hypothetical protein
MSYRTMDIYINTYFFGEHPMSPPNKKRRIEAPTEEKPSIQPNESTSPFDMTKFNHELLMEKISKLHVF